MGVTIITDSTAYIDPQFVAAEPKLKVVPLTVHFESKDLVDGLERIDEFFALLAKEEHLPTTSQPAPGKFLEVYRECLAAGDEIVGIYISAKLSGTVESARTAAELLQEPGVSIVDSESTVCGLEMLVKDALAAAKQGAGREEIVRMVEEKKKKLRVVFVPDTLEYLHKGGRIGGAAALLGTLLQVRPILHLHEGRVEPFAKVRTKAKAMQRLIEEIPARVPGDTVWVLRVGERENADQLAQLVQEVFPALNINEHEEGPVIGTHTGPGVFGLAFYTP